ncbi:hypothetical protein [Streptomyces sp. NPDC002520]
MPSSPNLAGSEGNELARLGRTVVEEAGLLVAGDGLRHAVGLADLDRTA